MSSGTYFQCEGLAKTNWTRDEDMAFEKALLTHPENMEGRWQLIADAVPGRTVEEVFVRYQQLMGDLDLIEAVQVDLPYYPFNSDGTIMVVSSDSDQATSRKVEKKKGTPWTEEEHRRFLKGLEDYGKGDWRSISRNSVVTRTPTQVASHAQKYFLRQSSQKKERKRASIHDITTPAASTMVVQPSPSTNNYNGQGGSGGGGGSEEYHHQIGYEHHKP